MELLFNVIVGILFVVLGLFTGILAWIFKDTRDSIQRKVDILEAKFHEFEHEKFNEILLVLNELKTDVAVIKNEIENVKKQKL